MSGNDPFKPNFDRFGVMVGPLLIIVLLALLLPAIRGQTLLIAICVVGAAVIVASWSFYSKRHLLAVDKQRFGEKAAAENRRIESIISYLGFGLIACGAMWAMFGTQVFVQLTPWKHAVFWSGVAFIGIGLALFAANSIRKLFRGLR